MFDVRFGSYSIVATLPTTPSLFRLKSMMRYLRLCPPPWWRTVILPWLLRPAFLKSGASSVFSGWLAVISSNVETDIARRAGEVGLYFLIGTCFPSLLFEDD